MSGVEDYVYYNGVEHGVDEERARIAAFVRRMADDCERVAAGNGAAAAAVEEHTVEALRAVARMIERGDA